MPWSDFNNLTLLTLDPDEWIGDEMERLLKPHRGLRYGGGDPLWKTLDHGIITKGNPSDLMTVVGSGDRHDHVMFFPNEALKAKWYRFNDDIDWGFARSEDGPQGFEEYVDQGFSPFDVDYKTREPRSDVPEPLKWWLIHCRVLGAVGVNSLRPMRALWWG